MIDGFRYGFIGVSDGTLWFGMVVVALTNAALFVIAYAMIAAGYKLKH
jgi:ABC-2 type transport system permease protein